jgi:hypothetical protein
MKNTIFWNITTCSPLSVTCFHAERTFSTLKMEAICSSEMSADTQRTTLRYTLEDGTLHFIT